MLVLTNKTFTKNSNQQYFLEQKFVIINIYIYIFAPII